MAIREALTHALSLAAGARSLFAPVMNPQGRYDGAAPGERSDGWVNTATGFGTSRDKTGGTYYSAPAWLTDQEIADLYNNNDLAAKCVNIPIREAFKSGYGLGGIDDADKLKEIKSYLAPYQLLTKTKTVATYADLFGGAALWLRFADGKDPREPLASPGPGVRPATSANATPPAPSAPGATTPAPQGGGHNGIAPNPSGPSPAQTTPPEPDDPAQTLPQIDAIEIIDKRFLWPFRWYTDGPKAGQPMTYQLWVPRNGGVNSLMGEIHESRLIRFYGAPTDALEKLRRIGWNQSVLQRPYEALQAAGVVWKAIDILVVDANQAVYSIAGLWRMITSDPAQGQDSQTGAGPSGGLLNRIRFMDLMRSVSRAIVLDKDDETFERKPTTFTGLPELSERQWVRVSAAFDIPLPLLTGEYPSGLQSTGEGPFRVFYANVKARQEEDFGPKLLETIKLLLRADGAPDLSEEELADLTVEWLPLWEPTAAELADIRLKRAQEGDLLVNNQAITPEELALSLPEEWYPHMDRELRAAHTEEMTEVPSVTKANADAEAAKAQADALAKAKPVSGPPGAGKGGGGAPAGGGFPPKRA